MMSVFDPHNPYDDYPCEYAERVDLAAMPMPFLSEQEKNHTIIFLSDHGDMLGDHGLLVKEDEDDEVFIKNLNLVIAELNENMLLGFYECPFPYKRLLSESILNYSILTKRFLFLKDTCSQIGIIKKRLKLMKGSDFKLFNANSATLSLSLDTRCDSFLFRIV